MANRWGNSGNSVRLHFWGSKSLQMVIAAMKLKDTYSLGGKLWPLGGRRRRERQRMRWLDGITDSMDMGLGRLRSWWWTGRPGMLWFVGHKESDTTERLNWNWNWKAFDCVTHKQTQWIWVWTNCGRWRGAVLGVAKSQTQLVEQEQWAASTGFSQFHSFHPAASEEETFVFFKTPSRFSALSYIPHENHRMSIKGMHSEADQTSVQNLTVPLNHVTLSLLIFLSKPQFPHLLNQNKSNS